MFGNHFIYRNGIHFDETAPVNTDDKTDVTKDGNPSIKDAVAKAVEDLKGTTKEDKTEDKKEDKTDDKTDKKDEKADEKDDEDEEDELTDEEKKHAHDLFKAFKDPVKGKIVLEAMAKEAGLTKDSTKTEVKDAVKTIEGILEKHLGAEFPTLAKILGPAIKEAVEMTAEANTKVTKEYIAKQEEKELQNEINNAMQTAFGRYEEVPDEVLKEVIKLMDEFKPSKRDTASMQKYFSSLTVSAADNLGVELKKKTANSKDDKKSTTKTIINLDERRERNRTDAKTRLASEDKTTQGRESKPEVKSVKDAVELAVAQLAGKK